MGIAGGVLEPVCTVYPKTCTRPSHKVSGFGKSWRGADRYKVCVRFEVPPMVLLPMPTLGRLGWRVGSLHVRVEARRLERGGVVFVCDPLSKHTET